MTTRTSVFATNDNVSADDLNALAGAWNTYTPTITQVGTVTHTPTRAKYIQFGHLILCSLSLDITGSGTAGTAISVTLPVPAVYVVGLALGSGEVVDVSAVTGYPAIPDLTSSTTFAFLRSDQPDSVRIGASPSFGLASGDVLRALLVYEAA